jgi:hypothetical protein
MSHTDLTLIVTAHDETVVCGPTMRAAEQAVAVARVAGWTVQQVIALDNATPATTAYFLQSRFAQWEHWEMQETDGARLHNNLVQRADGRSIAYLRAGDLFSENWLAAGLALLAAAEGRGERAIAHPELDIVFDGVNQIVQNIEQDSPLFTPHFLQVRNYYDSLGLTPRQAHVEVPYVSRDLRNGSSSLDWQFAIETMSRGWKHVVVPDTIVFKRRGEASLASESRSRGPLVRSVPELAIDRLGDLG